MLFQPTNLTPSNFMGFGADVIDVNIANEFSLQINGNSALVAYQLTIMKNDANNTVVYNPSKTTLSTPLYPINHKGEQQYLKFSIPAKTTTGMENGEEYKWQVRLWWSANDADSIYSTESFFRTNSTPTVIINNNLSVVDIKNIELTATYSQAEGVPIQWFRWLLMSDDKLETVFDTGEIYSVDIRKSYDALEDGKNYSAKAIVKNANGVEVESDWYEFDVAYPAPSVQGYLSAEQLPNNSVMLKWDKLKFIEGSISGGAANYLPNTPIEGKTSINIDSGQNINFDDGFDIDTNVTHVWNGKLPSGFDGVIYKASNESNYNLEIRYSNIRKRFEVYINNSLIGYAEEPIIDGRWFVVRATNAMIQAWLSKTETHVGSFTVQNLLIHNNFTLNGNVAGHAYIDMASGDEIIKKASGSFSLKTTYEKNNMYYVKIVDDNFQVLNFSPDNINKFIISDVDFSGMTSLTEVNFYGCLQGDLNISVLNSLSHLNVANIKGDNGNKLTSISTGSTDNNSLTTLNVGGNPLGDINVSKLKALKELRASDINCSNLDLSGNGSLNYLELHNRESLNQNPILGNQTKMKAMANSLPNRVGLSKGIINTYPSDRNWIKSICDVKNWETYRVATFGIRTASNNVDINFRLQMGDVAYVDWGDGSQVEKLTVLNSLIACVHRYKTSGNYVMKMYLNNFTKIGDGGTSAVTPNNHVSITSMNFTELTNLTHISFRNSGIFPSTLDITGLVNLTSISGDFAGFTSLVTGETIYPKVSWLDLDYCPIGDFSLSMFPGITSSLLIDNTKRSVLDVSPCPNITYIRLGTYGSGNPNTNTILNSQTDMVDFANTLPNRTGKSSGKIQLGSDAWNWISSICTTKNWIKA